MNRHRGITSAATLAAIIVCALLSARPARAAAPLTLNEALQMALAQHPSVQQARAVSAQAAARVQQAQAAWFPSLRLSGTLYQYEEPMAAWPIHGFDLTKIPPFDETLLQGGVQLDYTLFDGGTRRATVRQAQRVHDASGQTERAAEQLLIGRVVGAYLAVIAYAELDAAHARRIAAVQAELDRVTQMRAVGRAADVDVARARAALAGADADRVQAQSSLEVARRELARLIGMTPDSVIVRGVQDAAVDDRELENAQAIRLSMTANPEIEAARLHVAAAEAATAAARGKRLPTLGVRGNWVDFRDGAGHDSDEWTAAAFIGIPLFTGGAITGSIREADASRRAAAEELRITEDRVATQADRTVAQQQESRARVESLKRAVESMEEVVRIEKLRLDTGSDTQADYLRAEADLLAARAGLIGARHTAIGARVELARLSGELSVSWIEHNLEQDQ